MKYRFRHIVSLLSSAVLVLLAGCSTADVYVPDHEPTMLYINVFSPSSPVTTRGDVGDVTPSADESKVTKLQIWVFSHAYEDPFDSSITHDDGECVGYIAPTDLTALNAGLSDTYMMAVSDAVAQAKPTVDVYVLANVTEDNSGVTQTLGAQTTRAELEAALMGDKFNGTQLTTTIPADGLPMSGKLTAQPIYGTNPVLRIGTAERVSIVPLVRMVSKVRFVFSRLKGSVEYLEIKSVNITGSLGGDEELKNASIAKQEYLFFDGAYNHRNYRITSNSDDPITSSKYETQPIKFLTASLIDEGKAGKNDTRHDIAECTEIYAYRFMEQTGQLFEDSINSGVKNGVLTQRGPFYLRETDRQLCGEITYDVISNYGAADAEKQENLKAGFSLNMPGDFSRNHSWVVYAFYHGGGKLQLVTTYVKEWADGGSGNHEVYNW